MRLFIIGVTATIAVSACTREAPAAANAAPATTVEPRAIAGHDAVVATAGERNMISSESFSFHVNPVLETRHKTNPSKFNAATKRIPALHSNPVSQMRQAHNAIVTKATAAKSSNFHQVPKR